MEKNTREIHCHKYDLRERERERDTNQERKEQYAWYTTRKLANRKDENLDKTKDMNFVKKYMKVMYFLSFKNYF